MLDFKKIPSPCYVMEENLLRKNLELIRSVKERADVNIILAFKAFAMWKAFPIIREYIPYSTASSIYEAQLAYEEMGSKAHTYSPAYTEADFPVILKYSSHITFNSVEQYHRFKSAVEAHPEKISCGLRINPEYSEVETDLYNPCSPQSRLGILCGNLKEIPEGIEGLHFHALCESSSYALERTLQAVEERIGQFFPRIKWLNMGGGHLMTRKDYDVEHLISLLKSFKRKYPHLEIILEPGSAFVWQTGVLVADVVDIVDNGGIKTAILNVSFTCHLPDCLEMPYKPVIRNATDEIEGKPVYRMGGNSCLAGDFMGNWSFDKPLKIGDKIVFEDMIHYTMVKTTMFNGIPHPAIGLWTKDNEFQLYREFGYDDYKNRMS
ncbi:MAG: carboxynorspermidine decarboxylase [Candidatus Azobacteroides sp.]|nr:carboxynorspermidine decarboxylase [Candidatus Azobacteroides sp.]